MVLIAAFLLLTVGATGAKESPVAEVVTLLQEMLEKSKADGVADRTAYGKFLCYCDTNTEEKTKSIANGTAEIELMEATLADRRAQNERLSQEVFELKKAMDENEAAREEATSIRDKERADFEKEDADLVTGLSQLDRAIKLLQAVGADQTQSLANDPMAGDATAEAKAHLAGFMVKKQTLGKLSDDMKSALRAASVFLTSSQRKKMTSFLAIDAPGNYNAQSGEIVGILKSMNDTFTANLANARASEQKAQEEYDEFMALKETEFGEMKTQSEHKKELIGNNAAEIATTESEKKTKEDEVADNRTFLEALAARCAAKKQEFDKRNMLRASEEAAVAQAIAILNSDASFDAFGKVGATGGTNANAAGEGGVKFLQLSMHRSSGLAARAARVGAIKQLLAVARQTKSLRMARAVSMIAANNPLEEVLAKIRDIIALIDKEEAADENKKAWCDAEQSENEANKADKETDIGTLETNINNLEIAVEETKTNIEQANEDLGSNREAQAAETSGRKDAHAVFQSTLSNAQDAETIIGKAIEVLTKYYDYLKRATGPHSYVTHTGKDSGGSNLERLAGKSVDELEEACSANAACVGFNTAGWLKSALAPEGEWFDWDGGDLVVKQFEGELLQAPEEVEEGPEFSNGQGGQGKEVLDLLAFIKDETKTEGHTAIETEKSNQAQYETNMQALTEAERGLQDAISKYENDLATTEKRLEQAHADLAVTKDEHAAIVRYLAEIEPGCTFIITNHETRKSNRASEKAALEGAIETLEASPAFQNFQSSQESEDLGKCSEICNGKKDTADAACQACQEGVTIAGYCAQKSDAPGCAEATATGSAEAMNAPSFAVVRATATGTA